MRLFHYLLPFHLAEGSFDQHAFLSTWNAHAQRLQQEGLEKILPKIRLFTPTTLQQYWKSEQQRINRSLSYDEIKSADRLLQFELQHCTRGGTFHDRLLPSKSPAVSSHILWKQQIKCQKNILLL